VNCDVAISTVTSSVGTIVKAAHRCWWLEAHSDFHHGQIASHFFTIVLANFSILSMPRSIFASSLHMVLSDQGHLKVVVIAASNNDIVHLEHHAAELRGQEKLRALRDQRVDNEVLLHVV